MTRAELSNLKAAHEYIIRWGNPFAAAATLTHMIKTAEREHAAEDAHHDAESIPINAHHQIAAE